MFWGRTLQHTRLCIFLFVAVLAPYISCSPLSCFCCDMANSSVPPPPVEDYDISVPVPIHLNWCKRAVAIAGKYNSAEYILLKLYAQDDPSNKIPLSPDPTDFGLSKRSWEKQMKNWRQGIRARILAEQNRV